MKCAIFGLLALCAFQIVFADDSAKKGDDKASSMLRPESERKLTAALDNLQSHYYDTTDALKPKGAESLDITMLQGNCMNVADNTGDGKFMDNYSTAADQCNKCYDTADQTKDTKAADKCCDEAVKAFLELDKKNVEKATACVKKCLKNKHKSGAHCKKMLTTVGMGGAVE